MDDEYMLVLNEQIEIEKLITKIQNKNIETIIKYLQKYITKKIETIIYAQKKEERQYEFIVFKMTIYYFIMILKIRSSTSNKNFTISNIELNEYLHYDEIYNQESLSSITTKKIYQTLNILYIEKYIKWLLEVAFNSDMQEMIYLTILIQRLCYLENDDFMAWLKDKYDAIPVVLMILIRKMYGDEECYENSYYVKRMHMSLNEVNNLEVAMLMSLRLHITDEECSEFINEMLLEKIQLNFEK
jgi:hypothetical protein